MSRKPWKKNKKQSNADPRRVAEHRAAIERASPSPKSGRPAS
jgi:hypothetical protein